MKRILSAFLLAAILFIQAEAALCADLLVMNADNYESKKIHMIAGQTAIIRVYLRSIGEPVTGYDVLLFKVGVEEPVKRAVSNVNGEVVFVGIAPGNYKVSMIDAKRRTPGGMIEIGDFTVSTGTEE